MPDYLYLTDREIQVLRAHRDTGAPPKTDNPVENTLNVAAGAGLVKRGYITNRWFSKRWPLTRAGRAVLKKAEGE